MDDEQKLTQEQQADLKETLERGVAFEEMLTTKGWTFIQAYYQNQITMFVSTLMNQEAKPITEFENKRQELLGLKKLLGQIDSAIQTLQQERSKQSEEKGE